MKTNQIFRIAFFLLIALMMKTNVYGAKYGKITAIVKDSTNNSSLQDVEMIVINIFDNEEIEYKGVTDSTGTCRIEEIDSGYYDVKFVYPGYRIMIVRQVVVYTDRTPTLKIELSRINENYQSYNGLVDYDEIYRPHPEVLIEPSAMFFSRFKPDVKPVLEKFKLEPYTTNASRNSENSQSQNYSSFSLRVMKRSYSSFWEDLVHRTLPPQISLNLEEIYNHYDYEFPVSNSEKPLKIFTKVIECPWNDNNLVFVNLFHDSIITEDKSPSNLVFVVDVSMTMYNHNYLSLIVNALKKLANELEKEDHISIVTYGWRTAVHLEATSGDDKNIILKSILKLSHGKAEWDENGLELALQEINKNYHPDSNNQIIICSDDSYLFRAYDNINKIKSNNLNINFSSITLERNFEMEEGSCKLFQHKNVYNYFAPDSDTIDRLFDLKLNWKKLNRAEDINVLVEFNPEIVKDFHQIGAESGDKIRSKEVMNNSIMIGNDILAIYEIETFDKNEIISKNVLNDELGRLKVVYNESVSNKENYLEFPFEMDEIEEISQASGFAKLAMAVTYWGKILNEPDLMNVESFDAIINLAKMSGINNKKANDFIDVVEKTKNLYVNNKLYIETE